MAIRARRSVGANRLKGDISCVGGADYAANFDLVKRQLEIRASGQGFEFSKWLILEKVKNSYETIRHISDNSHEAQPMLERIKEQADVLKNNPPDNLGSLLAVEGIAAAAYFRYWYTLSLKWRGLGRKPMADISKLSPRHILNFKKEKTDLSENTLTTYSILVKESIVEAI